jgi:hypothetical protein
LRESGAARTGAFGADVAGRPEDEDEDGGDGTPAALALIGGEGVAGAVTGGVVDTVMPGEGTTSALGLNAPSSGTETVPE